VSLSDSANVAEAPGSDIPALTLLARTPPEPLTDAEVLSWYGWTHREPADYSGVQAVGLYRSLGERRVIHTRSRLFDDGHTILVEVGRAGAIGYLFARATTGYAKLRLCSFLEADRLTASFEEEHLG